MAQKETKNKLRVDLVDPAMITSIAEVLEFGANKYAEDNWKKKGGVPMKHLYGAALRHMLKWKGGTDIDEESGLHHLKHAACNLAMMCYTIEKQGK